MNKPQWNTDFSKYVLHLKAKLFSLFNGCKTIRHKINMNSISFLWSLEKQTILSEKHSC